MSGRWLPGAVILLYFILGGVQIAQRPGLQYDEALLVAGAVHMRHSPADFPLPHSEHTWACALGRCLPLMAEIPYVGAIKEYLAVPIFAAVGPSVVAIRVLSLLLGSIGIWGLMRFATVMAGEWVAWGVGLALAINPAYVDMTVFDNNALAGMMAGLGLLFAALARYLSSTRGGSTVEAFLVGFAAGFAIWTRANLLWTLAAMAVAAVLVYRGLILKRPLMHWIAAAAGGIAGGLPFLVYQIKSGFATWQAVGGLMDPSPMGERLFLRLVLFAETLVCDREHRAMWGSVEMGDLMRWVPLSIVLVACVVCFSKPFARFASLCFLVLTAILFATPLQLAEHHLIVVLPFAVLVVVLAAALVAGRYPRLRIACIGAGAVYLGVCLYWQVLAVRGLHETGGVGMWSNSVTQLTGDIERNYPNQLIKIVDWGLQDNLYVLSDGRIQSREIFWGATPQQSGLGRSWKDEIRFGGVFVAAGAENRHEPPTGTYFMQALAAERPVVRQNLTVAQKSGVTYAEIFDVEPNSVQSAAAVEQRGVGSISMGDPASESSIGGFHKIENGAWRWTQQNFFVMLAAPSAIGGVPWLELNLYLPDGLTRKLGPLTLSARVGTHTLKPERYEHDGPFTYSRALEKGWLEGGGTRIDFSLDKVQAPTLVDKRALGIIVKDVSIRMR
ncbi:MAG TPA: hypothetical protein VGL53_10370 [Bryobacteraceae bacterium]|jgi:hypothetical protein